MTLTLGDIAGAVGGRLHGPAGLNASGVSIDTRTLERGDLFFAIRGDVHDGHEFVDAACLAGASAVVVSQPPATEPGCPWILVADTLAALQGLAARHRLESAATVVGLTGSCGKTSTKEFVAAVLGEDGAVHATSGNLNNHIGVPLTLLGIDSVHEFAVVEMGANHHGEIALLTKLADPDVGLVTCVAPAHTEFFGSVEGVARAKGELFAGMREDGTAVVNVDDPLVEAMPRRPRREISYSAIDEDADVLLTDIRRDAAGRQELRIRAGGRTYATRLAFPGRHQALNAIAAMAVVLAVDRDLRDACDRLESVEAMRGRGAVLEGDRLVIIDDSYNSNPISALAAIHMLGDLAGGRRRVAVLGDMYELGERAGEMHADLGLSAATSGVDFLVSVGIWSQAVVDAALSAGMAPGAIASFTDTEEAVEGVRRHLRDGDVVLVKGSRGMKMERIVDALLYWPRRTEA